MSKWEEGKRKRQAFLHAHSFAAGLSQPLRLPQKRTSPTLTMPHTGKTLEQLSVPIACGLLHPSLLPLFLFS